MGAREIIIAAAFLVASMLLIFKMGKENKIFYVLGGIGIAFDAYYITSQLVEGFSEMPAVKWGLRVAGVLLALWLMWLLRAENKKSQQVQAEQDKQSAREELAHLEEMLAVSTSEETDAAEASESSDVMQDSEKTDA